MMLIQLLQPINKTQTLNKTLQQIGFQKKHLLSENNCSALVDWYYQNTPKHPFSGFYSTMFFKDPQYRQKVDNVIKKHLSEIIETQFPNYRILFANFIMKEARTMDKLDLHADWLYCDESKNRSYNLWVNLNANDADMGLLSFIPKSHKWNNPYRFTPYETPKYFNFISSLNELVEPVNSIPGDAVLYDGSILHASAPNTTSRNRLAINMVLLPKETPSLHLQKSNNKYQLYKTTQDFYYHYKLDEMIEFGAELINEDFTFNSNCFTINKVRWCKIKRLLNL